MPTYQYECADCGHEFEKLQSMTEPKLKKCPKCGKSSLNRLIGTGSGIIFKGTGFYETDYKKKIESSPTPSSSTDSPKPQPAGSCGHGTCGCTGH